MFAVIERQKEVSVVPLSWIINIDGQQKSYWPPGSIKTQNVIKTGQPPSSSWLTYPVRVLRTEGKMA